MARLTARLVLLALRAHELLRLRARLRPPLRTRLRRIRGRRLRSRPRVLARLRLQPTQPLLQRLYARSEIKNELDTRLPTSVIDRLRLRAVHDCKIRCTNRESLPKAPTTERLRRFRFLWSIRGPIPRKAGPQRAYFGPIPDPGRTVWCRWDDRAMAEPTECESAFGAGRELKAVAA
jgi:hypothetical protein